MTSQSEALTKIINNISLVRCPALCVCVRDGESTRSDMLAIYKAAECRRERERVRSRPEEKEKGIFKFSDCIQIEWIY